MAIHHHHHHRRCSGWPVPSPRLMDERSTLSGTSAEVALAGAAVDFHRRGASEHSSSDKMGGVVLPLALRAQGAAGGTGRLVPILCIRMEDDGDSNGAARGAVHVCRACERVEGTSARTGAFPEDAERTSSLFIFATAVPVKDSLRNTSEFPKHVSVMFLRSTF